MYVCHYDFRKQPKYMCKFRIEHVESMMMFGIHGMAKLLNPN